MSKNAIIISNDDHVMNVCRMYPNIIFVTDVEDLSLAQRHEALQIVEIETKGKFCTLTWRKDHIANMRDMKIEAYRHRVHMVIDAVSNWVAKSATD